MPLEILKRVVERCEKLITPGEEDRERQRGVVLDNKHQTSGMAMSLLTTTITAEKRARGFRLDGETC